MNKKFGTWFLIVASVIALVIVVGIWITLFSLWCMG